MIAKSRMFFALALFLVSMVMLSSAAAGDLTLEKQLQQQIIRSRELVTTILSHMHAGKPYQISFTELTGIAAEIKTLHAQISEKFEQSRADISSRGVKAADRHTGMVNSFSDTINEYLGAIATLQNNGPSLTALEALLHLLDRIAPPRLAPIYGALPYHHKTYAARKPVTAPGGGKGSHLHMSYKG